MSALSLADANNLLAPFVCTDETRPHMLRPFGVDLGVGRGWHHVHQADRLDPFIFTPTSDPILSAKRLAIVMPVAT